MAKVFIGVGHGGKDSGAVGYLVEKEVNLVEALACRDFLEAHGVQVLMSRTSDEDDLLSDEINGEEKGFDRISRAYSPLDGTYSHCPQNAIW